MNVFSKIFSPQRLRINILIPVKHSQANMENIYNPYIKGALCCVGEIQNQTFNIYNIKEVIIQSQKY